MPIEGLEIEGFVHAKTNDGSSTDVGLYILSAPDSIKRDRYKIGYHTGTLTQLRKRYITSIPDLIICDFYVHPEASAIEFQLKDIFASVREKNEGGNLSEFIIMKLDVIRKVIEMIMKLFRYDQHEIALESPSPYFSSLPKKRNQDDFLVTKKT